MTSLRGFNDDVGARTSELIERLHVSRSALMTMWLMERLEREAA